MNFKKLNDLAKTPTRGSQYAAGWDLYAATDYDIWIDPHETIKIGTGIAVELPTLTFGEFSSKDLILFSIDNLTKSNLLT